MEKRKLNYRFHNPNLEAESADYILKIMVEVNKSKAQAAIQNGVNTINKTLTASKSTNEAGNII